MRYWQNSDFIINLLKDRTFLHYTPFPYPDLNCENEILNHESIERIKNNIDKGDKKKIIILGDSLLNGINWKAFSKKHSIKVTNKQETSSEYLLLEELD